ncbi:MAG: PEP-utilizing enzyme [bacterium]
MHDILNYKWEKYVGRRQPPIRGELAFHGVLKWFKDWGFEGDFSKLYIYFSKLTEDKGIISDHYINVDLHKEIVTEFKKRITEDITYVDRVIDDLKEKTAKLKTFSLDLNEKHFTDNNFIDIFKNFCQKWEDFGPNLYVFLLLSEACENIVLEDYKYSAEAKTKLMQEVSADVESEFFSTDKKDSSLILSYFEQKHQPYITMLTTMTEYRDQRKVIYDESWYCYATRFLQELETRIGLGEKVNFLSKENIIKKLQGQELDFVIEFPSVVYGNQGDILYEYGHNIEILQDQVLQSAINFTGELKGTIASKGKVVGKVRLVEPHVPNQKLEQGEVLVTRMTTPDLMPLIKKAVAIVTDEGGVTCHAAIVSRELEVPCVIATNYSTQVFKDGDLIEVDANRGIVRKLFRN